MGVVNVHTKDKRTIVPRRNCDDEKCVWVIGKLSANLGTRERMSDKKNKRIQTWIADWKISGSSLGELISTLSMWSKSGGSVVLSILDPVWLPRCDENWWNQKILLLSFNDDSTHKIISKLNKNFASWNLKALKSLQLLRNCNFQLY